jgi:LytS/YehU family sensor histidine kinase
VITILCYAVVTFLPSAIIPHHFSPGGPDFHGIGGSNLFPIGPAHRDNTLSHLLREHFFQFLMAFVFSLLLKTFHLLKETEKKKVSSELSLLKAQINPHFLFNTLNSIYSTAIDEKAVKTQKAILNLSGMMRYITTETDTEYISLEKELHYINSYIDLQKLKLADTIELDYILQGTMERKKIAPLILITFIENAFKHGVSSNNKSPINIHLRFTEKYLTLNVQNKKSEKFQEYITKTRIGLDNTISRLKLLYPHNHQLEITDDTENYQVKLTMELL